MSGSLRSLVILGFEPHSDSEVDSSRLVPVLRDSTQPATVILAKSTTEAGPTADSHHSTAMPPSQTGCPQAIHTAGSIDAPLRAAIMMPGPFRVNTVNGHSAWRRTGTAGRDSKPDRFNKAPFVLPVAT